MAVDPERFQKLAEHFVADMGGAITGPAVMIGEQLGLYRALHEANRATSTQLAERTGIRERYLREWLAGQAASGYIEFDAKTQEFWMTPEQTYAMTDETSPLYIPGAFYTVASVYKDQRKIADAIKNGRGLGWHEHHNDLFLGTKKFFRPAYLASLVGTWLPALEGVVGKLERGAKVADVGCGLGASTIIMAKAYPKSEFVGFDYHTESIEWARNDAVTEKVARNVDFQVAEAKGYPGKEYDLVAFFDCLHDMGDPVGAARHVLQTLKPDGTLMVVEPFAKERLELNLNPVGRIFYNASTLVCVPASLAQDVGLGLGAQASDASLAEVFRAAGFTRVRKAIETPFNRVFEARP